MEIACVL